MARIKLSLPENFSFSTQLPVRITDLNYGGHLGNDAVLSLIHEARVQFVQRAGFTELNFAGVGLIMADAAIEFKAEAFYGNVLTVFVTATAFSKIGFELYYKIVNEANVVVAVAKTGMVCFDYTKRKVAGVPNEILEKQQRGAF